MREKAIRFWLVVKVEQVKLKQPKCLCGTLLIWVAGKLLKAARLSNKYSNQIQFSKHLAMLKLLEITIPDVDISVRTLLVIHFWWQNPAGKDPMLELILVLFWSSCFGLRCWYTK